MGFLTALVPLPARIMLMVAFAIALMGFGYVKGTQHNESKWLARSAVEATQNAKLTDIRQQGVDNALNTANASKIAATVAADKLRAVNGGLQRDLTAARSAANTASVTSCRQYAATASAVLGECASALEGLAGQAQGHAIDSLMYQQSWPK